MSVLAICEKLTSCYRPTATVSSTLDSASGPCSHWQHHQIKIQLEQYTKARNPESLPEQWLNNDFNWHACRGLKCFVGFWHQKKKKIKTHWSIAKTSLPWSHFSASLVSTKTQCKKHNIRCPILASKQEKNRFKYGLNCSTIEYSQLQWSQLRNISVPLDKTSLKHFWWRLSTRNHPLW